MAQKILIMEDEELLLNVLEKKLKQSGYEVKIAHNGQEGLSKIKETIPDLILLDIIMPIMDGYEVLETLHQDPELSKIPVIIISNSGQPVEIERAQQLGARDYLIKTEFEPEEVIEKVKNFIGEAPKASESESETTNPQSPLINKTKKVKILIVEDDKFLRELAGKKLTQAGFEVIMAIDGETGLKKIIEEKPSLVLLDIILPGIDGFEILKQIRGHPKLETAQVPIILLSNLGQESDIEKGKRLGANDYLIKAAFTTDEIVTKIKKTLGME